MQIHKYIFSLSIPLPLVVGSRKWQYFHLSKLYLPFKSFVFSYYYVISPNPLSVSISMNIGMTMPYVTSSPILSNNDAIYHYVLAIIVSFILVVLTSVAIISFLHHLGIRKRHVRKCDLDHNSQANCVETSHEEICPIETMHRSESALQCQSTPEDVSTANIVPQLISPNHTSNNGGESLTEQLFTSDDSNQHLHMRESLTQAEVPPSAGKELDYSIQDNCNETFHLEICPIEPMQRSVSEFQCQSAPENVSAANAVPQVISPSHASNKSGDSLTEHVLTIDASNQHLHMGQLLTKAGTRPSAGKTFMLEI